MTVSSHLPISVAAKMKTIFTLLVAVILQLCNAQYSQWKRGSADQFAIVNQEKQLILMSNLQFKSGLPPKMIPSISFHDFNARFEGSEKPGMVALKLLGVKSDVCVITTAERPFSETLRELKSRSGTKVQSPEKPKTYYKAERLTADDLTKSSAELGKFCDGLKTYKLVPTPYDVPLYPWWPWWRTWCIWIEFPIYIYSLEGFEPLSIGF